MKSEDRFVFDTNNQYSKSASVCVFVMLEASWNQRGTNANVFEGSLTLDDLEADRDTLRDLFSQER